jgi:hypothetical protein
MTLEQLQLIEQQKDQLDHEIAKLLGHAISKMLPLTLTAAFAA